MKKILCLILTLITLLTALPYNTYAKEGTVLTVTERSLSYNTLSWSSNGVQYDGTLIEKSTDKQNWTQASTYYWGEAEYYDVETSPKAVTYYRVTCFTETEHYDEDYNYTPIIEYATPSNLVEVFPAIDDFSSNAYNNYSDIGVTVNWSLYKDSKKYVDGFDVFRRLNGGAKKLISTTEVKKHTSKSSYAFNYTYSDNALPKYAYTADYCVRPYFKNNGEKLYMYGDDYYETVTYVSNDIATVTTKRKKITIKLKKLDNLKHYKIRLTKYKLKNGKSYKTKTVKTAKKSYTIKKIDTKDYGYNIEVIPVWSNVSAEYGAYLNSHNAYSLFNGTKKVKKTTIKVINTRGKKDTVDWTYQLTASDKKTIKKFFDKKYKGKNPTRAEMAEYALNWINKKVDYDYAYKNGNRRYVDAIFHQRSGQCLQYNGAYAAVLTYLGYEARVIEGYRADANGKPTIPHFWCEVKLNGRWYLCETGNYGKNGYWMYFGSLYRDSRGYMKYGKAAKDN